MTSNFFYKPLWIRPFLWLVGGFPAHPLSSSYKNYGINQSVKSLELGYTLLIFPEGKRVKTDPLPAKPGLEKILQLSPETKVIISHIEWQKPLILKSVKFSNYSGLKKSQEILNKAYEL